MKAQRLNRKNANVVFLAKVVSDPCAMPNCCSSLWGSLRNSPPAARALAHHYLCDEIVCMLRTPVQLPAEGLAVAPANLARRKGKRGETDFDFRA